MVDEQEYQKESFTVGCIPYLAPGMIAVAGITSFYLPKYIPLACIAAAIGVFALLRAWLASKISYVWSVLLILLVTFNREWPLMFRVQWILIFIATAIAGVILGRWLRKRRLRRTTQQV